MRHGRLAAGSGVGPEIDGNHLAPKASDNVAQLVVLDHLERDIRLGLLGDADSEIAFKGSMNETWPGLSLDGNLESVDVFVSWGGEREQVLPTPFSLDALPFMRPDPAPLFFLGRPFAMRKQKHGIEPLGKRWATYEVPACNLTGKAPYCVDVKLVAGMIPVNLVHAVAPMGFEYGMSPRLVADRVVAGHVVLHEKQVFLP